MRLPNLTSSIDPALPFLPDRTQFDLDLSIERYLAANCSVDVLLVSHQSMPHALHGLNHTRVIHTTLMPNEPADFSRNSYDQMTINSLMLKLGVGHFDLLRLAALVDGVQMWEMVHYMTVDNLLANVHQFHLVMSIGKAAV